MSKKSWLFSRELLSERQKLSIELVHSILEDPRVLSSWRGLEESLLG